MSDYNTNTTPAVSQKEQQKNPLKMRHSHIPPKSPERDTVVMMYRCRMISAARASELVGLKRTAFYSMLRRYGFNEGSFEITSDEESKSIVESFIRKMGNDQCKAAAALMGWLESYMGKAPKDFERIDFQKGRMSREDLMILDRRYRQIALEQAYEKGYRQGHNGEARDFQAEKWMKEEILPEAVEDPFVHAFLPSVGYDAKQKQVAE